MEHRVLGSVSVSTSEPTSHGSKFPAIKATFQAEQIVTEYADFFLEDATRRVVRNTEESKIIAELRFLPQRTGRLPHLSILFPNLLVRVKVPPKAVRIRPTSGRSQKSRNRVTVPI
jgi:hypothetical protein